MLHIYDHFEDSTLVSYKFESGNFVDKQRVSHEFNTNQLCLLFQRMDDKWFYWTTWKDFNPQNQEHLNYNDFVLIQAKGVKWRIIE